MFTDLYILLVVYRNGNKVKSHITRGKLLECLDIVNDISKNNEIIRIDIRLVK